VTFEEIKEVDEEQQQSSAAAAAEVGVAGSSAGLGGDSSRFVPRGVSMGVEDGSRSPALRGRFGAGPPAGRRRVGHRGPG
jgi:hypothetical protein